ncbi:MAG: hypothetical protein ACR2P3_05955 [Geminicoccaceae bacterium]
MVADGFLIPGVGGGSLVAIRCDHRQQAALLGYPGASVIELRPEDDRYQTADLDDEEQRIHVPTSRISAIAGRQPAGHPGHSQWL